MKIPAITPPHDFEFESSWRFMSVKLKSMNLCRKKSPKESQKTSGDIRVNILDSFLVAFSFNQVAFWGFFKHWATVTEKKRILWLKNHLRYIYTCIYIDIHILSIYQNISLPKSNFVSWKNMWHLTGWIERIKVEKQR